MPSMMEIYKEYADQYDRLVAAEDWKGNLPALLHDLIDWNDRVVYEAGIGTGRITEMFIKEAKCCFGFDREQHMLDKCMENLSEYAEKLFLSVGENTKLPGIGCKADVFIEGWSLGHTIIENENNIEACVKTILEDISTFLDGTGQVIIIESLGTFVSQPTVKRDAIQTFFELLEDTYSFVKYVLSTDYCFSTVQEAAEVMGFFFGEDMKQSINRSELCVIPEYTGIWYSSLGR